MRARTMAVLIALASAGCGDDNGGNDGSTLSLECQRLAAQLQGIVLANRACQVKSDCHWLADRCLGECASFVNSDGLDAARAVIQQATQAQCNAGCSCLAQMGSCNHGVCGPFIPSSDGGL